MLFFVQLFMILILLHKMLFRIYFENMNCKYGFL